MNKWLLGGVAVVGALAAMGAKAPEPTDPDPKPDPKPDIKPDPGPLPDPKPDPGPTPEPKPAPEPKPEPKPDIKPVPGPQNDPPLGGLTEAERNAADAALALKPQSVPANTVPEPENVRKAGTTDAAWYSNVAYWTTYRRPEMTWVSTGHTPAPVKIPAGSVWAPVWTRINAYVTAQLKLKPQPKPDPKPVDPKPLDPQTDKPPLGGLTAIEKSAADAAIFFRPVQADPSVIPPPDNVRPANATDASWLTNYAYWAAYRSPTSDWIKAKKAPAPVKIPNAASVWAPVWKRINSYVVTQLAQKQGAELPPVGPLTAAEKSAADAAIWLKPVQADAAVVPPPDNVRPANATDAGWLANYSYWAAYRSPTSDWVTSGKAPAPVKIPDAASPWAAVWSRIFQYVSAQLGGNNGGQNNKPAEPPPGATITALEKSAADAALWLHADFVDPSVVPPPDDKRKPNTTDAVWFSNVSYWAAYRSPTSDWVKSGNPPAPVKIPAGSVWVGVWTRINNYVKTQV